MHKPLTEPLHLCRTCIPMCTQGKVRIHTAIPTTETLYTMTGIIVPDIITLASRAYKRTSTARQTGF